MGQRVPPGLVKRGDIWYIKKTICGRRIQESAGTSILAEAERYLAHRMEQIRNAEVYGVRPKRTFREAATKYLNEATKVTIREDVDHIRHLDPFIGDLQLENVHMGTLQAFIANGKAQGVKNRTVNYALQVVRHMLNLAASEWLDQHGMTWLQHAPKIKLLPETDRRAPYPMSWTEQEHLFDELPDHLRKMALFKVNTGCRESEVCGLRWEWEVPIPELNTSVFIIPGHCVKNREDRLVVLNSVAKNVVEELRGTHLTHVFTYRGRPVGRMYTASWRKARERAGLPQVRVHDLKHSFGRRLRSAGVSFEDRQDLLGHKSGRITTQYSAPELINLIEAAERVCPNDWCKSGAIVVLRKRLSAVA
jgi:integrase